MAKLHCPRCQTVVALADGWAAAAVSTTIPAPAVPDMATQVRCPNCQLLFAAADVRHEAAARLGPLHLVLVLAVLAALAWWLQ